MKSIRLGLGILYILFTSSFGTLGGEVMKNLRIFSVVFVIMSVLGTGHAVAQSLVDDIFRDIAKTIIIESKKSDSATPAPSLPSMPKSVGTEIHAVQARLKQLGYDLGPVDGVMGGKTAAAIRRFQSDHGIPQTGRPTQQLLAQLNTTPVAQVPLAITSENGAGPSFDCTRASTPAEHAICNSAALSERDRRMADSYSRALSLASDPGTVKNRQRAWLQTRSACGGDPACLTTMMDQRIAELGASAAPQTSQASPIGADQPSGLEATLPSVDIAPVQQQIQPPPDGVTLASAAKDIFLIPTPVFKTPRKGGVVVAGCLETDEIETLRPTLEQAISGTALVTIQPASELTTYLQVYSESYVLVDRICLEKMMFSLDSAGKPRDQFEVIQIAKGIGPSAAPAPETRPQTSMELAGEDGAAVLLRLYLPTYLAQSSQEDRIKLLSKFIVKMQSIWNPEPNEMFTAEDIKDRNPDFLAREFSDRWDAVLKQLSLTPPVIVSGRMELNNYKYDFDTSMLIFPYYQNQDKQMDLFPKQPGEELIYAANIFNKPAESRSLLDFLSRELPYKYPMIRSDRRIPAPRLPMSAQQAEKMTLDHTRIAMEASYRITAIEAPNNSGNVVMVGSFLGMEFLTDTGVQLAAIQPEDLPLALSEQVEPKQAAEPEPEPVVPEADASKFAIIGITLGMPLEEAIAKVVTKGAIIYRADIEPETPENVLQRYTLVALDTGETFALHVADQPNKPVTGIARKVPVAKGVPVDSIRAAFVDAYGDPTATDEEPGSFRATWHWGPASNQNDAGVDCKTLFEKYGTDPTGKLVSETKDIDALEATFKHAGKAASRDDGSFLQSYTRDRWPRVAFSRNADLAGCRPFLNVFLHQSNNDFSVWVHLVDPAPFANELKKIRAAVEPATFNSDL